MFDLYTHKHRRESTSRCSSWNDQIYDEDEEKKTHTHVDHDEDDEEKFFRFCFRLTIDLKSIKEKKNLEIVFLRSTHTHTLSIR